MARPVLTAWIGSMYLGLHLGSHPPQETAISAVPDGHGVRLHRPTVDNPTLSGTASDLGAAITAAMLTAECFKTITSLAPGRHQKLDRVDLCPVSLGDPGEGRVSVVDPEAFEPPNVITYSLGAVTAAERRIAKVELPLPSPRLPLPS